MRAPDCLRGFRAFTLWRAEPARTEGAKPIKVPMHHDGITRHSTANPAPLLSADEAEGWLAYLRATGVGHDRPGEPGYLGLGFRPSPANGIVVLDLDDQLDSPVLPMLAGGGLEVSISGKGLHSWGTSTNSAAIGRRGQVATPLGKMELYADGQFIALGTWLGGDARTDLTASFDFLVATYFPAHRAPGEVTAADWEGKTEEQRAAAVADLRSALKHYDPDNRDEWVAAGQSLSCLGDLGRDLWVEWSATSTRFPGGADLGKWDSFTGERSDYRAIFARAQTRGWTNPARGVRAEEVFSAAAPLQLPGPPAAGGAAEPMPTSAQLTFAAAAAGAIPASLANVEAALMSAEGGVSIAHDDFRGAIMIGQPGAWRPLTDVDYGLLRAAFERRGFKAVPAEIMKTAIEMVAHQRRFDSAIEWAETLKWDGVLRIDNSMARYLGAENTPYTRAVGAYLWTALAGRCLVPGIKADMALILVSPEQGKRKTSVIEAIAPYPDAFVEVSLEHRDEDMSRKMRGKLVAEIAEMRGLKGRDSEAVKAWVSRRREEWTPKYREFATTYDRRLVLIGTANEIGLLSDPSGERRWLPMLTTGADEPALRQDRDQLWAEGVSRFKATGIAWQEAERLAKLEHKHFTEVDPWQELVVEWLWTPPVPAPGDAAEPRAPIEGPVKLLDVLRFGIGMPRERIDRKAELRVAGVLRGLGMVARQHRDGKVAGVMRWFAN